MAIISFNFAPAETQRMATAVGSILNLGRDATLAEVKAFWTGEFKRAVLNVEQGAAAKAIVPTTFADPT